MKAWRVAREGVRVASEGVGKLTELGRYGDSMSKWGPAALSQLGGSFS